MIQEQRIEIPVKLSVTVDGEMLNNILVKEDFAKVAYVYLPDTRYLSELESSQESAKAEK